MHITGVLFSNLLIKVARPLHQLTEKNRSFVWDDHCQSAFVELKRLLTSSPILAYPVVGLPYLLDTDASSESLGSVLSQVQDGQERVICYYSRSFTKPEPNYCVTRKELLAKWTVLNIFIITYTVLNVRSGQITAPCHG